MASPTAGDPGPSSSPGVSLLRVLCLHDQGSNSLELSKKLDSLGNKLYRNHGIDLVFVDAPLIVDDEKTTNGGRHTNGIQNHPPRTWWEEERVSPGQRNLSEPAELDKEQNEKTNGTDFVPDPSKDGNDNYDGNGIGDRDGDGNVIEDNTDFFKPTTHYVGLDASLLLLKQVWASSPFWGILAVGQAAGVAALLPLLPGTDGKESKQPAFAIFVNGETLLDEVESLTEHLNLPCLHIVDRQQQTTTPDSERTNKAESAHRLLRQFGGKIAVVDESLPSSLSYSSTAFNNHVGRFLVSRKKDLRGNARDAAVLALRHELHRTEADAARVVAREIAQNPPDALMAVINPKNVGGFRERRRGPGEEGGGAPCPSEFLLHRAKRSPKEKGRRSDGNGKNNNSNNDSPSSTKEGASRHHPNHPGRSEDPRRDER